MKDKVKRQMEEHHKARKAHGIQGGVFKALPGGMRMEKQASGTSVKYCSACRAPVVDSPRGWYAHYKRSPFCNSL